MEFELLLALSMAAAAAISWTVLWHVRISKFSTQESNRDKYARIFINIQDIVAATYE